MRTAAEEKKVYGYVVYIRAYATADNQSYKTGTLSVYYGGIKKSFLGYEAFEPYKSEASALKGRAAWEKMFAQLDYPGSGWRHQVGGVMQVTEAMYKEVKEQFERDFEIAASRPADPMMERMIKNIEKEEKRSKFKIVK